MRKLLQLAILALLATSAFAADECTSTQATVQAPCVAQLSNGFQIRHIRREVAGENVRLFVSESSYTELPASQIVGYEADLTPISVPEKPATPPPVSLEQHVARAGETNGVDADFIRSVIQAESGANPKAVSRKGAQGLMQLMPATATKLGVKDSFDPAQNVNAGAQFLRELLERYHGDAAKALAAYNAGPLRVQQYGGVPPYQETRQYVARVIRDYNRRKAAAAKIAPTIKKKQQLATTKPPRALGE
jgi:soluble lytic murein transglycosylase-like protein